MAVFFSTLKYRGIALLFYVFCYLIIGYLFCYNRKKHQHISTSADSREKNNHINQQIMWIEWRMMLFSKRQWRTENWLRRKSQSGVYFCLTLSTEHCSVWFKCNPVCKWKKYIKLVKSLNLHFQFERQTFHDKFELKN